MTFTHWYVRRGRITRRTWWLHYALPIGGLSILAAIADTVFGYPGLSPTVSESDGFYAATGGPFETLVALFTLVPSITSSVTRLHDRDHSAWWLLWWLLPLIGLIVVFIQNGFLRGYDAPNKYGPPPQPGEAGSLPYRL